MSDVVGIRQRLKDLYRGRATGDLPERRFEREQAGAVVDLCRAVARERLGEREEISAEHHVVHAHMRMNESVLREPGQECTSLFLTSRRVLRLRFVMAPGRPPSCDASDGARWDEVGLPAISALVTRREIRSGEAFAGAVVVAVAFIFGSWLEVTGLVLFGLGLLGILHALLLPTRWIEIRTTAPPADPDDVVCIHAVRKKSARTFIGLLKNTPGLKPAKS